MATQQSEAPAALESQDVLLVLNKQNKDDCNDARSHLLHIAAIVYLLNPLSIRSAVLLSIRFKSCSCHSLHVGLLRSSAWQ